MKKITILLDDEVHKDFKLYCTWLGVHMTQAIRQAILERIKRNPKLTKGKK